MESPVYPNHETRDYGGYELDLQLDFTQFLEEARLHARERNILTFPPVPIEVGGRRTKEDKKSKVSWKSSLFKWWKADKKHKQTGSEPATISPKTKLQRQGHVSGPIRGSVRAHSRQFQPSSGPLTSLLSPLKVKKSENEIPYMCLDDVNNDPEVTVYGPIYSVT
ncbi:hypothetical protein K2173_024588 [Erythroxylum novogranatense]|uniref:Uncharacterized protein n=1 Tax=Erythroxylum novogranatense TaxID=1862640 RepID=A0AAV8SUS9_9ROSI|nr:hypothetical protein K2173_024588 [Erythroxylum novogranatense]